MSGAILAGLGAGGASGSGGVAPSPAPVWTNISGWDVGSTNNQTLAGITSPIGLSASWTGGGFLIANLNGVPTLYTGAFTVHAGDVLSWSVGVAGATQSGAVTVRNVSNGGATLASFTYVVRTTSGGGGILP